MPSNKDYDYKSDLWTDKDRENFDRATLKLARVPIEDRRPRNTTGQIFVWREGNVVVVRRNETLDRVFKKLTVENFLSCPVVDDTVASTYCGMISIMDMVVYITEVLFQGESSPAWIDFFARSTRFRSTQVHEIMAHTRQRRNSPVDVYKTLSDGYSLLHALETLARTGCHRVPVVNSANRIVGIYTESMGISDIRQSMHLFGSLVDLKVEDMQQSECVFTVRESDRAIDAFRKMSELQISGLPIVDADGVLTGAISVRDLRGVGTSGEHFSRLYWSVKDYKNVARKEFPHAAPASHWTTQTVPKSARYVTPSDDFATVIRSMNDGNMHRIYVCSEASAEAGKPVPIAVISQGDVITTVLKVCGTISK